MAKFGASPVLVLCFLLVAAFCVAEASASSSGSTDLLDLQVTLANKCSYQLVRLDLGLDSKILSCEKGEVTPVLDVKVTAIVGNLLKAQLYVLKGNKLVEVDVKINLTKVVKVVSGVLKLVFEVLDDVKGKSVKLLCNGIVINATIKL